jgi:hypothetical protein
VGIQLEKDREDGLLLQRGGKITSTFSERAVEDLAIEG